MSRGLAMGWGDLSPATQDRLARDAWLLAAWWTVVGLACSWLLLEFFRLRSPILRYPATALVMYALGVVTGTRLWLVAFSRAVRLQPRRFGAASAAPAGADRFRRRGRFAPGPDLLLVGGVIGLAVEILVSFESGATLFWWTLLTLALALGVYALIGMERLGGVHLAGVLAELAHQFVFGRSTERGFLPHRAHDEAWPTIVRETWGGGATFLIFSIAAGVALVFLLPDAVSLADIFR
jgi:hypothetical protein